MPKKYLPGCNTIFWQGGGLPGNLLCWEMERVGQRSPILLSLEERIMVVRVAPLYWNRGVLCYECAGGCKIRREKILIVFV